MCSRVVLMDELRDFVAVMSWSVSFARDSPDSWSFRALVVRATILPRAFGSGPDAVGRFPESSICAYVFFGAASMCLPSLHSLVWLLTSAMLEG